MAKRVLFEGKFIRLIAEDGWEYVQRANCTGIVIVLAKSPEGRVLLVEQFRKPVGKRVIEFPAGLVKTRAQPARKPWKKRPAASFWRKRATRRGA